MKAFYKKGEHIILLFRKQELNQGLGIIRALAKYFNAKFLHDMVADVERDLAPQKLPALSLPSLTTRLCENCCTEIDLSSDEYVHVDNTYMHKNCPPLKENRPI